MSEKGTITINGQTYEIRDIQFSASISDETLHLTTQVACEPLCDVVEIHLQQDWTGTTARVTGSRTYADEQVDLFDVLTRVQGE